MKSYFGQVVKSQRHRLNLTQKELAEQASCATITVRRIESNTLKPSLQLAEKLAEVLAVPPDERDVFFELARASIDSNTFSEEIMGNSKTIQEQRRTSYLLLILPLLLIVVMIVVNPNYLFGLIIHEPPFVMAGILPWGWLIVLLIAGLLLATQRLLWRSLRSDDKHQEENTRDWSGLVLLFLTFPTMFIILVSPAVLHVFRSGILN